MPVTFDLREDGHVAYYTVTDPWTKDEFVAHYPLDIAHRTSVKYPVHWVLDFQGTGTMPPGILRARDNSPLLLYPKTGDFLIVGGSYFVRTIAETILRLLRFNNGHFFRNDTEAWVYLRTLLAKEKVAQ
ncbi:MAG: hypothetical protein ABI947_07195 [Chloroflexota bacterium]